MKTLSNLRISALLAVLFAFMSSGCLKTDNKEPDNPSGDKKFNELKVAEDFTWRTSKTLKIDLTLVDKNQNPVAHEISFYADYPDGARLLGGQSRSNGKFQRKYTVTSGRMDITAVLPGQNPVVIPFTETEINGFPAFEIVRTIVVENPGLKSLKAFTPSSEFPCEGSYGTIVFEDSWPHQADYDFNDVVIDYNVKAIYDDDDLITNIEMRLFLRAAGASNDNAFGISFRQYWSYNGPFPDIASVTVNGNIIQPENTVYPAYILIPSTKAVMPALNTIMNNPFDYPIAFFVEITFNEPIDQWDLELPLQNPFIVVNQDRGREVHLPFDLPTSLADPTWAGKGKDATDPDAFLSGGLKSVGGYFTYMTQEWYPYALHVYFEDGSNELFQYPTERRPINEAYTSFQGWVENWSPWNWYMPQYRAAGNVYSKTPNPPYGDN